MFIEKPADPRKLRAAIDILVAAFPDVPSSLEVRVILSFQAGTATR
jgi:hypothetical protein